MFSSSTHHLVSWRSGGGRGGHTGGSGSAVTASDGGGVAEEEAGAAASWDAGNSCGAVTTGDRSSVAEQEAGAGGSEGVVGRLGLGGRGSRGEGVVLSLGALAGSWLSRGHWSGRAGEWVVAEAASVLSSALSVVWWVLRVLDRAAVIVLLLAVGRRGGRWLAAHAGVDGLSDGHGGLSWALLSWAEALAGRHGALWWSRLRWLLLDWSSLGWWGILRRLLLHWRGLWRSWESAGLVVGAGDRGVGAVGAGDGGTLAHGRGSSWAVGGVDGGLLNDSGWLGWGDRRCGRWNSAGRSWAVAGEWVVAKAGGVLSSALGIVWWVLGVLDRAAVVKLLLAVRRCGGRWSSRWDRGGLGAATLAGSDSDDAGGQGGDGALAGGLSDWAGGDGRVGGVVDGSGSSCGARLWDAD